MAIAIKKKSVVSVVDVGSKGRDLQEDGVRDEADGKHTCKVEWECLDDGLLRWFQLRASRSVGYDSVIRHLASNIWRI